MNNKDTSKKEKEDGFKESLKGEQKWPPSLVVVGVLNKDYVEEIKRKYSGTKFEEIVKTTTQP